MRCAVALWAGGSDLLFHSSPNTQTSTWECFYPVSPSWVRAGGSGGKELGVGWADKAPEGARGPAQAERWPPATPSPPSLGT